MEKSVLELGPIYPPGVHETWSLPSRQVTVAGRAFQVSDVAKVLVNEEERFLLLQSFTTVSVQGVWHTYASGQLYSPTGAAHPSLNRAIYRLETLTTWIAASALQKIVSVSHSCVFQSCSVQWSCSQHRRCSSSCPHYTVKIRHKDDGLYLIEENFRALF